MADDVFSVSKVCEYLERKLLLDPMLSKVKVRGEVTNFSLSSKGQAYFSIKDSISTLSCVVFDENLLKTPIENGSMVVLTGEISFYKRFGKINFVVSEINIQGTGDLYERFLMIKAMLQSEGLFDAQYKKPLPEYPFTIGIITSAAGAAMHDIINVASRRFAGIHIKVYSAVVQGNDAPYSLITGLDYFEDQPVDLVIIGRGGGSFEDLSAFNDENLARRIFAFSKPIVSAVGHEVDYTICDFVSDFRAATPSAAAELCVPVLKDILLEIDDFRHKIAESMIKKIGRSRLELKDHVLNIQKNSPDNQLISKKYQVEKLKSNITNRMQIRMESVFLKVKEQRQKLVALSPKNVLKRGFAYIVDQKGENISRITDVQQGELFDAIMYDGKLTGIVKSKEAGLIDE